MVKINLELVRIAIMEIFSVDKVTEIKQLDWESVNTLLSFKIDNTKYLMKILTRRPTNKNEEYRFAKEAKLLKLFKKKATVKGLPREQQVVVPVPKVHHYEDDISKIGYKFIIMEYLEEKTLDKIYRNLPLPEKKRILEQLAQILKDIHSITYEMFGEIEDYETPRKFYSFRSYLQAEIRRIIRSLGPRKIYPIGLLLAAQDFVETALEKLPDYQVATLVHNDLNLSNFFVSEKNGSFNICALIDFEWSLAGIPEMDILNLSGGFLVSTELEDFFYERYFSEGYNRETLSILKQIILVINKLNSVAYGWIYFHPTKENIEYVYKTVADICGWEEKNKEKE